MILFRVCVFIKFSALLDGRTVGVGLWKKQKSFILYIYS